MNKQSFLPSSPILGNVIRTRGYISRFRAAIIAIGIFALLHFYFFSLSPGTPPSSSPLARLQNSTSANNDNDNDNECETISKGLSRVVITIHTGATEVLDQIPTQMRTTLRCAPNILIFSDMSQRIGPWEIHDALSSISPLVTVDNTDFDLYRKQQALRDPVKIASILKDFKDPQREDDLAAWTLAKYKNVPIVRKAWELMPGMDWYFHVDADTYVMLPSLVRWIETLDPRKERFLGSLIFINDKPFAHGGSGVLLSNAATRTFVDAYDRNGTAQHWDEVTRNECCGDFVLGRVLESCGINVTDAVPTINGDNPETIPFGPDHWCQPVVTMHHVSPAQREQLIQFEQRRKHPLVCPLHSPYTLVKMAYIFIRNPFSTQNYSKTSSSTPSPPPSRTGTT